MTIETTLTNMLNAITTPIGAVNGSKDGILEQLFCSTLIAAGFVQDDLTQPLAFQYQPNGTQSPPDFMLWINGKSLAVELKSAKKNVAMWNSRHASLDTLYVFQNTKTGKVSLFFGSDIITQAEIDALAVYTAELDALAARFGSIIAAAGNNGWGVYPRRMFTNNRIATISVNVIVSRIMAMVK